MDLVKIDGLLKSIKFDDFCIEATFQFKLLMQLAKVFDECSVFPEKNIEYYRLNVRNFSKKEVDIIIEQSNDSNIAIELKMPMNGQVPEKMYKFIEDIKFLEELKATGIFGKCYLIVVTNDAKFWQGNKKEGIYSFFRNRQILRGKILKPTGNRKKENYHQISNEYQINWNSMNNNFRYFVVNV
ncbi:MAG: hypothetical protein Pg6C_00460 [Treponemataceae bacterium]|nr:MAG: hypothetical protein Pg6C_00460 [Treponemataceae bacterium]